MSKPATVNNPDVIKDVTARLRRIEGQARGIQRMIEEGRPCADVIVQLSALRNAVNKVATTLIVENLEACILQKDPEMDPRAALQEAKRLFLSLS